MSDVLTLSQIKVPGTASSKNEAIQEAGQILVDAGAVSPKRSETQSAGNAAMLSVASSTTRSYSPRR